MKLESLDSLIISLLDVEANMGVFKKELSEILDIPLVCIDDPFLKTEIVNGVVRQYLYVGLSDKIPIHKLMQVEFDCFHNGFIVFDIGDTVL